MNLLSIQSHVAYGHVGNSAVVFALQRLGVEVWSVNTVQFSNHTGYDTWKGQVFDAKLISEVVQGIDQCGVFGECDGVLSGYLGSSAIGEAILDAVVSVKRANPSARYCCDPVIGDVGQGTFVGKGIPEFIKTRAVAVADVVTPNQFELDYLVGTTTKTAADVVSAMAALRQLGPRVVFVTSCRTDDTPEDCLDLMASDEDSVCRVRVPLLPLTAHGAGDVVAGLFLAHHLRTSSISEALVKSASAMYGILNQTAEAGSREMLLVAAQEELVSPSTVFEAEPVGAR
jgi:pyridoxine kinase